MLLITPLVSLAMAVTAMAQRTVHLNKRDAVVSQNMPIKPDILRNQSELAIALHPSNPNVVVAGWNSGDLSGIPRVMGWSLTTDGGSTWFGSDTLPTHPGATRMADPALGIDLNGNLFFNAQIRSGTSAQRFVARSTNNGTNWNLATGLATAYTVDKQHLTIDTNPESPFKNYVYTACTKDVAPRQVVLSYSSDSGKNFASAVPISGSINGLYGPWGVNLAVGLAGELYATWVAYDDGGALVGPVQLGFNKSTDGGATWGAAMSLRSMNFAFYYVLSKGGTGIADWTYPSMAVDRSHGPQRGWLYVTFADLAPNPNIYLIRSTDDGSSWSNPVKVNQDNSGHDHWNQWMTVDDLTGAVYVMYYDSRRFPANDSAEIFMSSSTDGGQTFDDVLISDAAFLPSAIPGFFAGYMGDYNVISALNNCVWLAWNDNRTGVHQAYAARVAIITSVQREEDQVPSSLLLEQNYPNPFNPTTAISYQLPTSNYVSLEIFDVLGREVAMLVNGLEQAGSYTVSWEAANMPSGIYYYRLTAGNFSETRKMILMK